MRAVIMRTGPRHATRSDSGVRTGLRQASACGAQSERLPPARMKATISCTIGWSVNSWRHVLHALHQRAFGGKQRR